MSIHRSYVFLVKCASHHQSLLAYTDSKRVKQFSSASAEVEGRGSQFLSNAHKKKDSYHQF